MTRYQKHNLRLKRKILISLGRYLKRLAVFFLSLAVAGTLIAIAVGVLVFVLVWPKLPDLEQVTRYEPILPLKIYTKDRQLIGEFGSEHRTFTPYAEFPPILVNALIAAEDKRFFEHSGFDPIGLTRAALVALQRGRRGKGTSTITQQLARNFYLSQERTIWRKLVELLLAIKIERAMTKEKILEVYMNQIYLGQRSFGFTVAAQTYFGKKVEDITLSEAAILAGLPKFPSINPVSKPKRVLQRRTYTLNRMLQDDYITESEHDAALKEPVQRQNKQKKNIALLSHVAEMARQYLIDLLKAQGVERAEEIAYSKGFHVITTIDSVRQQYAIEALQHGLIRYELGHGFRGPETRFSSQVMLTANDEKDQRHNTVLEKQMNNLTVDQWLKPAVVTKIDKKQIHFYIQNGERFTLNFAKNRRLKKFTQRASHDKKALVVGSVVRVFINEKINEKNKKKVRTIHVTQLPEVEGALVAVNPQTAEVEALIGGYSFSSNQFNRVTQAWRQPGSTFKPFIYSAAIDYGFGAGTMIEDKMLEFPQLDGTVWKPKNYDEEYEGPITLREALAKSKNSVTLQVLDQVGIDFVMQYIERFGFDPQKIPAVLSMGLGAGEVTPMQMAAAYSEFANGGYRINPYFIDEVRDSNNQVYYQSQEQKVIDPDNLVLDPRNVYIINSMLEDVTRYGTAARARRELRRHDIAGKTGTTNEYIDAWFCGYQESLVSVVWVGYDQPRKMGRRATGGRLALPIWIDFMKKALKDVPDQKKERPRNIGAYKDDLILKEFEKNAIPSQAPWEAWDNTPDSDNLENTIPPVQFF